MPKRYYTSRPVVVPIGPSIAYVELTKEQWCLIDREDAAWCGQWSWFADWDRHTKSYRVKRNITLLNGKQKRVYMHRELLAVKESKFQVDHKNNDTLDNRKSCNLRIATGKQNNSNRRRRSDNVSGYKGVHYEKGATSIYKWRVEVNGKFRGYYPSPEIASQVYCEEAAATHKEFFNEGSS